jgi:two-component system sensor histidine kinase BaeS
MLAHSVSGGSIRGIAEYRNLLVAENQRVTVTVHGHSTIFGDPLTGVRDLFTLSVPINDGSITLASPIDKGFDPPFEIVLITLGVLLIVLGSVFLANRTANRQTRSRVEDAVRAAERVSLGDFTARIGSEGPEPIVRLGAAFDAMATRLESIDREQREFLADLAHEIATPIQALSGFSQAVIDGTIPIDTAQAAIESQTTRLSELLDELTQLRSLDAPGESHLSEVDLYALAHSLYVEFKPIATAAGIEMQFRSESVTLLTEQKLVETVLRNFITNALRYTPRGQLIAIRCKLVHHGVVLSVSDTGLGIAAEHQQRIFDRFYRTTEARDRISGGTGLGLTIARRAAHSLGGHIELESELGQGSDFRLVLPLT